MPIITLKLNGGIASIAILNKDHTDVQTKIRKINRKIGKNCFEKFCIFINILSFLLYGFLEIKSFIF